MSVALTTSREAKARSSSRASKSASRDHRPMYGDAGSWACSPPICSRALAIGTAGGPGARSSKSCRARVARLSWSCVRIGCGARALRLPERTRVPIERARVLIERARVLIDAYFAAPRPLPIVDALQLHHRLGGGARPVERQPVDRALAPFAPGTP